MGFETPPSVPWVSIDRERVFCNNPLPLIEEGGRLGTWVGFVNSIDHPALYCPVWCPCCSVFCLVFLVPHFSTPSTPPTHPDAGPGSRHGRAMYVDRSRKMRLRKEEAQTTNLTPDEESFQKPAPLSAIRANFNKFVLNAGKVAMNRVR